MTSKEALAALTLTETNFIGQSPPHHHYRTYQPFGVGIFLASGLGSCGSVGGVADCGDGGSGW